MRFSRIHVAVADRDREAATATAGLVTADGGVAHVIEADISCEDDIVRMVNATVDANKTSTVDTLKMIVGSMEQGFRQTYVTVIFLILERRGHIELK